MKKIIVAFLISSLLLSSCAYNISKGKDEGEQYYYAKINKICEDKDELSIITKENKIYKVNKLVIDIDTTSFFSLDRRVIENISTNTISRIEFPGTDSSTFEGLMFGGLAGGIISNILSNPAYGEARQGKAIYLLLGVVGGAIVGVLYSIFNPGYTIILITE